MFEVTDVTSKEATFTLLSGKLRAYFAGVFSSRMSVRTNNALCAVRGTEFEVGADGPRTDVHVREGHLEVSDKDGHSAVVTSEETVAIGPHGLEKPKMVSLLDERAQPAARPMMVRMELANDATRGMLEDLRTRDLKANEAQLGKDAIDAFGRRVRVEEYLLRPASNQFKVLFLAEREKRFDWGHFIETFNSSIPDDITQVGPIVSGTFLSKTSPSNWLTNVEFFATNTVDSIKETIALGNPVAIDFSGYGAGIGTRYYPSSLDWKQILSGPGVPGGTRTQFEQTQSVSGNTFTWKQYIVNNVGTLSQLDQFQMDASNNFDVTNQGCNLGGQTCFDHSPAAYNAFAAPAAEFQPDAQFNGFATGTAYPRGPGKADFLGITTYPDGSTLSSEKLLVSNKGDVLDFSSISAADFQKTGNYNLEIHVGSSLFQGRDIDVLIAPEILSQKAKTTQNASQINP
jgi:hypothetical protein